MVAQVQVSKYRFFMGQLKYSNWQLTPNYFTQVNINFFYKSVCISIILPSSSHTDLDIPEFSLILKALTGFYQQDVSEDNGCFLLDTFQLPPLVLLILELGLECSYLS